jgi:hypothetical protein
MSMDFNTVYSKFQPAPKVHKMSSPQDFSYQFTQTGGKSNKSSKSNTSAGKSGKSSNRTGSTKGSKDNEKEPIRNLRATLDQVDLDRGAKPSNRVI